jgi:hypothetical protein
MQETDSACGLILLRCFLSIYSTPEDGGCTFHRNVLTSTGLHDLTSHKHSHENFKSKTGREALDSKLTERCFTTVHSKHSHLRELYGRVRLWSTLRYYSTICLYGLLNTLNCKDYCLYVDYIRMGNVVMNIEVGHDKAADNFTPLAGRTDEI